METHLSTQKPTVQHPNAMMLSQMTKRRELHSELLQLFLWQDTLSDSKNAHGIARNYTNYPNRKR
jgi:hypothetical protein